MEQDYTDRWKGPDPTRAGYSGHLGGIKGGPDRDRHWPEEEFPWSMRNACEHGLGPAGATTLEAHGLLGADAPVKTVKSLTEGQDPTYGGWEQNS